MQKRAFATLPGASAATEDLKKLFSAKYALRGVSYKPRTKYLLPDGSAKYTNRLFLESSPYLLQHAHNPVNWYPWGDEAFERAKKDKKPVLLSVGYSTCHWCHVMEEESFEDEDIARYLNEHYIAIKVDREERPDVDSIYMTAIHHLSGHGGWPMTVWLTPARTPFYGGTYYPAKPFLSLLKQIKTKFSQDPKHITEFGEHLASEIREGLAQVRAAGIPSGEVFGAVRALAAQSFDPKHGGARGSPKFPTTFPTRLLLWDFLTHPDAATLSMVKTTLQSMFNGGIYDQVGGGFHRYSTDPEWLVPHFEKMLYDNALLATTYLEAYQVSADPMFQEVTDDILQYVERDMTSPEGAFYSATDADSLDAQGERREGAFFVWTPQEIREVLSPEDAEIISALYGVTASGNFEGRNILHVVLPREVVAKNFGISSSDLAKRVKESKKLLYEARKKRPAPLRDEKVLTDLNGLMISAFVNAGFAFDNREYIRRAEVAANFILENLIQHHQLFHSFGEGRAYIPAFLDDYAFFIQALIDLYEATGEIQWLQHARALDTVLKDHFEDQSSGGLYRTSDAGESLLAREKPSFDNVTPSGNSVSALNLLRLAELTGNEEYRTRAENIFKAFSQQISRMPNASFDMLRALKFALNNPKEIAIITPSGARAEAEPFLSRLRGRFLPFQVLALAEEGDDLRLQQDLVLPLREKTAQHGKVTAYVCERGACKLPTSDPDAFIKQLLE